MNLCRKPQLLAAAVFASSLSAPVFAQDGAPHSKQPAAKGSASSPAEPGEKSAPAGKKGGAAVAAPSASPATSLSQRPPESGSLPDPTLKRGTIVVEVFDQKGLPLPGAKVRLLTQFMSVAEGNSEDVQELASNEQGQAIFTALDDAIRFTYAASVTHLGATYDVPGFRLSAVGQRVIVHTFPVTSDPREAFIGIQGQISVQLSDDLIRTDGVFRVINMSRSTWRPQSIFLKLPEDVQAVEAKLSAGDAGFEEAPGGMKLVGTFPPGQKDIPFSFHVPNTNVEARTISMSVPPHLVDLYVLTEEAPGLELAVSPGFPPAESRVGNKEKKVLLTRRVMRPGEGQLGGIQIQISGLPVIGPGRWIAAGLALLLAALGLVVAWLRRTESSEERQEIRDKARATLLDEILLLQSAHARGDVGPRTYEQTKREILSALARLEPETAEAPSI